MGLTAEVELELRDAGLIKFFEDNQAAFQEMAVTSLTYTTTYVAPTGIPTRMDDVAETLETALRTTELLRTFLHTKHLTQRYQYRRFADLILNRLWEDIHNDTAAEERD
jgi:hypothetical protein